MRRRLRAAALAALGALALGAPAAAEPPAEAPPGSLQARVDRAREGDVVELHGRWSGPVHLDKAIVLRGRDAEIDGGGRGTVVVVTAPGARVEGLRITGSGSNLSGPDACVWVGPEATGAVVRDNHLEDCAFGIWIHETRGAQVIGNHVTGRSEVRPTDRGNGIHLHDGSELVIRDNEVRQARDGIYVSATEDSLIQGNRTDDQRFGVHYMYSYRNTLRDNRSSRNVVGFALMESLHLVVEDNLAEDNQRNGLLFRDVQYSRILRNRLERNGIGMFFFSSTENQIEENLVAHNEVGLKVWAGTRRNSVRGNRIVGNGEQVFYVGSEDQHWGEEGTGNLWSDYLGWDQDGDGVGDRPHRVDSFTARLLYQYPAAVLLLRSPALETLAHLAERLPLLRAPTVVDLAPLVEAGPS